MILCTEDLRDPAPPSAGEMATIQEAVSQCDSARQNEVAKDAAQVFIYLVARILNDKER